MDEENLRTKWWRMAKRNWLVVALVFMVGVQFLQLEGVLQTSVFLQDRDSSLVEEIGQMKDSYANLGTDLNEIRQFLRLPSKSYQLSGDGSSEAGNELEVALFQYASYLNNSKKVAERLAVNRSIFESLKQDGDFRAYTGDLGLSLLVEPEAIGILSQSAEIARIKLNTDNGYLQVTTLLGTERIEKKDDLQKFLKKNAGKLKRSFEKRQSLETEISNAIKSEKVQKFLQQSGAKIELEPKESDSEIYYAVSNKDSEFVGKIAINKAELKISLVDLLESNLVLEVNDLDLSLLPYLEKLDTKSLIEHKTSNAKSDLEKTLFDEAFKSLLQEAGLTIAKSPREDQIRIYYDLYEGKKAISSIAIEKATGVVNIVKPDGTGAENILFFDPEFKKKTLEIPEVLPKYSTELNSDESELNILVAGKHGELVDTMIVAHINENDRSINLISIPRDLQYEGRKINSYSFYYGMPELTKVLGKISGYEIDKYILVDMYAFIEVVDLLGGVDISLKEPVADPTYKTVENGVAGTLYFEAGDHHVNGVQALRLARTRHTSSDFARSERQQMILQAMKKKAQNFGLGDAETIYQIAESILAKTESNISLDEAIAYYFRYQNYEIESMDVMSTANILYSPPYISDAQCQAMIAQAAAQGIAKPGCENENHAYILLPENGNWDLIKWFFSERFK